jgi:hypothetical protein
MGVGHGCLVSITATDEGPISEGEAVKITAYAIGATVIISPETISPGEVAKVAVTPAESSIGGNLTVSILGKHVRREKMTATIMVTAP